MFIFIKNLEINVLLQQYQNFQRFEYHLEYGIYVYVLVCLNLRIWPKVLCMLEYLPVMKEAWRSFLAPTKYINM